jgi:dihydrodipicolinate synthase/N-acetylneuraminate lyase
MGKSVGGLMPILATPFDQSGVLDLWSMRNVTRFSLESGVSGVAVFGMASEGFALRTSERSVILDTVSEVVAGHVPIVAGVSATSTVGAIEQALDAQDGGADVLMVLPPFMVKPPAGTIVDFYGEIATAVDIPVMVQDAPGVTGVSMSPEVIGQLSRVAGITSVKVEAPPTAPKIGAVVDAVDPTFAVLGGQNSQFCLEEYERGAVGTMPACEFSDVLQPILDDWAVGAHNAAREAFRRLLPLILLGLQQGIAWSVHKEVLVSRGIIGSATVRYPAAPIDDGTRRALRTAMEDLGLKPFSFTAIR